LNMTAVVYNIPITARAIVSARSQVDLATSQLWVIQLNTRTADDCYKRV
jgi:hypothetical protein